LLAVGLTAGFGAFACGEKDPRGDVERTTAAQASAEERALVAELRRAIAEVAAFDASARAQRENRESHREALQKARRVFDGLQVGTRIPSERDDASIVQTLEATARTARLRVRDVAIAPEPRDARTLPAEVAADEPFRFRPDDIREVLHVRFRVEPADIARLTEFDAALAGPEPQRFIVLERASATRAGFDVLAKAFCFVDVTPPRVVARPPDLTAILGRPSIAPRLERLREVPAVGRELVRLRERIERAQSAVVEANASLVPIGEANLWVARTAILERAAALRGDRPTSAILE
jgi:hypothetical protein